MQVVELKWNRGNGRIARGFCVVSRDGEECKAKEVNKKQK